MKNLTSNYKRDDLSSTIIAPESQTERKQERKEQEKNEENEKQWKENRSMEQKKEELERKRRIMESNELDLINEKNAELNIEAQLASLKTQVSPEEYKILSEDFYEDLRIQKLNWAFQKFDREKNEEELVAEEIRRAAEDRELSSFSGEELERRMRKIERERNRRVERANRIRLEKQMQHIEDNEESLNQLRENREIRNVEKQEQWENTEKKRREVESERKRRKDELRKKRMEREKEAQEWEARQALQEA